MEQNLDNQNMYNYKHVSKTKRKPKTNVNDRFNITYNKAIIHRNLIRNLAFSIFGKLKNDANFENYLLKMEKIK